MVILTEVVGDDKSNPEYNFLASSKQQIETPALPILPNISGIKVHCWDVWIFHMHYN